MSKRTGPAPAPVPLSEGQSLLFDVPAPPPDETRAARPASRACEVCGRTLRSARSVEAGAGQTCAAKVGVSVLVNTRAHRRARAKATAAA